MLKTNAIKIVKMKEDLTTFNTQSEARIKNLDLRNNQELTICMRVLFYQFPTESRYSLKWFPMIKAHEKDIFYSLLAFDTGKKSDDLYYIIPKGIFQTKANIFYLRWN